jgi:hypothetical protein
MYSNMNNFLIINTIYKIICIYVYNFSHNIQVVYCPVVIFSFTTNFDEL